MKTSGQGILWGLLACFSLANTKQLYEGDACNLEHGQVGVCTKPAFCPVAQSNLKKGIRPMICCFHGELPIVCCPHDSTTTTTTAATSAPYIDDRLKKPLDPNTKIKTKCDEYAAYANVQRRSGLRSRASNPDDDNSQNPEQQQGENSISPVFPSRDLGFRIIGGSTADEGEFPHMAALGFGEEDDIQWLCGGSLISESFVLTAAHCLQARGRGLVRWVRLGSTAANETGEHTQKVAVKERHRHDNYSMQSYYHDIALLELETAVQLHSHVRPACLHTHFVGPDDGECIATGWGAINSSIGESLLLMKVELPFQRLEICNATFRTLVNTRKLRDGIIEDTMICVGDLEEQKDTCQGDSGGPIQVIIPSPPAPLNMYSIVGVTSFGSMGCGQSRTPAIYTRVSHYIPWIANIVWPDTET